MAPLLLALLLGWAVSLDVARKHAESEQQNAESERQKAEGLLSFLLGEKFLEEVRDIGRSAMLEQVQEHVESRVGAIDQWVALNRGLALRNRGDLKRTQGSVAESVTLFAQALKAFDSRPRDPNSRREAARTHRRLGEALADQGQQALSHYKATADAWPQVVASAPAVATDDCVSLADSLVLAGELKTRMGEATLALTDLEEALKIASDVLFGRPTSHEKCGLVADKAEPYPDAKALKVLSRAALLRALVLNFQEDYEGATALAIEARALRPPSISTRQNALVALAWRGNGRISATPQPALDDYRKVLSEFEELRRWDPSNRLWQRERAATQLAGEPKGILACLASKAKDCKPMPSVEEAEAMSLAAMATLRALAQIDRSNVSFQRDLSWALVDYARVLAAGGRQTERLVILKEAERIYGNSQPDKADAEGVAALGRLLEDKSDALTALGRLPEAKESLRRSVDLFEGLIAAHPDKPNLRS